MKSRTSFFIDEELQRGLEELKARDGMPAAEAIRRAIAAFLKAKGIDVSPAKANKEKKR